MGLQATPKSTNEETVGVVIGKRHCCAVFQVSRQGLQVGSAGPKRRLT